MRRKEGNEELEKERAKAETKGEKQGKIKQDLTTMSSYHKLLNKATNTQ